MDNWYLDVGPGARAAVVNQSGQRVFNVEVSNFGHAVVHGQRNWVRSVPAVEDGEGIAFTYARAMGAHQDPPGVRVRYRLTEDEDGSVYRETFELP